MTGRKNPFFSQNQFFFFWFFEFSLLCTFTLWMLFDIVNKIIFSRLKFTRTLVNISKEISTKKESLNLKTRPQIEWLFANNKKQTSKSSAVSSFDNKDLEALCSNRRHSNFPYKSIAKIAKFVSFLLINLVEREYERSKAGVIRSSC